MLPSSSSLPPRVLVPSLFCTSHEMHFTALPRRKRRESEREREKRRATSGVGGDDGGDEEVNEEEEAEGGRVRRKCSPPPFPPSYTAFRRENDSLPPPPPPLLQSHWILGSNVSPIDRFINSTRRRINRIVFRGQMFFFWMACEQNREEGAVSSKNSFDKKIIPIPSLDATFYFS